MWPFYWILGAIVVLGLVALGLDSCNHVCVETAMQQYEQCDDDAAIGYVIGHNFGGAHGAIIGMAAGSANKHNCQIKQRTVCTKWEKKKSTK